MLLPMPSHTRYPPNISIQRVPLCYPEEALHGMTTKTRRPWRWSTRSLRAEVLVPYPPQSAGLSRLKMGIRMALGAQRKKILEAALGRAFKLLAFGSAAGLLLGILASRVLAFIVYQATPRDPLVLGGVILAMSLLGLLATWIPAQRALSIDPMILLREQ